MKQLKQLIFQTLLFFLLIVFSPCFFPLSAFANSQGDLETQVLEIIRKNPEVIIESVQAYQYQRQQDQKQRQQVILKDLQKQPQQIIGQSPTTGPLQNRAILLEFSDFQCPFCARAHTTIEQFLEEYGDRVTLVYKHLPLINIHSQALPAAQAAYAAQQQGQFWPYHDALFAHQDDLDDDFFRHLAQELGLDLEQFDRDRTQAAPVIEQDMALAQELGLNGTPYFFFQGEALSGAIALEDLEALLDNT
ncbi:MAG: thioredoxin domain-containing protein [Merismopedia sp. SIO2A8]|nr:thioredoxin domain-containing protein [Symploca sp. SIO2B6]NET47702.1 thioredoxin domain-containing protein [Merismopedia sp. SIO2A8]